MIPTSSDRGLTQQEYIIFTILFFFSGCACVLISSILYYVWRKDTPTRAKQVNNLGWIMFLVSFVSGFAVKTILHR